MKVRIVALCLLFSLSCALPCIAQEKKTFSTRIHNAVDRLNKFLDERAITTDTNYVARPVQPWTLRLRYKLASTYFNTKDNYSGDVYRYYFENDYNSSVGVAANYRGLSLSLALNTSKSSDTELNLNYYNNKFGFDFSYSNTQRFRGSDNYADLWGSSSKKDDLGKTEIEAYSLNAYYVFNRKRFSYPAAFTHSWIQRRSAGSFIAGATFYTGKFDVDLQSLYADKAQKLPYWVDEATMNYVSVNFGYAYNFVPNKHWVLHGSLVPGIMLWKNYSADVVKVDINPATGQVEYGEPTHERWPKRFLDYTGTVRTSATYSFHRSFIGASFVYQFEHIGDTEISSVFGSRWKMFAYYGIRL